MNYHYIAFVHYFQPKTIFNSGNLEEFLGSLLILWMQEKRGYFSYGVIASLITTLIMQPFGDLSVVRPLLRIRLFAFILLPLVIFKMLVRLYTLPIIKSVQYILFLLVSSNPSELFVFVCLVLVCFTTQLLTICYLSNIRFIDIYRIVVSPNRPTLDFDCLRNILQLCDARTSNAMKTTCSYLNNKRPKQIVIQKWHWSFLVFSHTLLILHPIVPVLYITFYVALIFESGDDDFKHLLHLFLHIFYLVFSIYH